MFPTTRKKLLMALQNGEALGLGMAMCMLEAGTLRLVDGKATLLDLSDAMRTRALFESLVGSDYCTGIEEHLETAYGVVLGDERDGQKGER